MTSDDCESVTGLPWSQLVYGATMDPPHCEVCGEAHATIPLQEVAACDDCAAEIIRDTLQPAIGKVCATILRDRNGNIATCLVPYGAEHAH